MRCIWTAICAMGLVAGVAGCGGANQSVAEPEVAESEEVGGGDEEGVDVSGVCAELCQRVAGPCTDDPTSEFDPEACEDSCLDETDGVLDEAGRCLKAAESCAAAVTCSESFGD